MKQILIALGLVGLMVFVTLPKLYKMAQIRGWIGGAVVQELSVLEKWHQVTPLTKRRLDPNIYWLLLQPGDIHTKGAHRTNMEFEKWNLLQVGDPIEVIFVPGDPEPYFRDDIFASNGNFAFDFVLLIPGVGAVFYLMMRILRFKQAQKAETEVHL